MRPKVHPKLGTHVVTVGYGRSQITTSLVIGGFGLLFFGATAFGATTDGELPAAIILGFFAVMSAVFTGYALYYRRRLSWPQLVEVYKGGLVIHLPPDPTVLRWNELQLQRYANVLGVIGLRLRDQANNRYNLDYCDGGDGIRALIELNQAILLMKAARQANPNGPLWVFKGAKDSPDVVVYDRGLKIGEDMIDFALIDDVRVHDGGSTLELVRSGRDNLILPANVTDFRLLQWVIDTELIDRHLVGRAKRKLQTQEISFSHAVITPSGVRTVDNDFWSWQKLTDKLIAVGQSNEPTPEQQAELGWFGEQVNAEDALLFMALLIDHMGPNFLFDLSPETMISRLRYAHAHGV